MHRIIAVFERVITYLLLTAGMVFILYQAAELWWELIMSIVRRAEEKGLEFAPSYNQKVVALFFSVLLALEILETVRLFDKSHEFKIRIILLVCLIAISRKILLLDAHEGNPLSELGLAALVLSFSVSYYLVSRRDGHEKKET
jgi:uncharacterized membrane protein (DUF373 family)